MIDLRCGDCLDVMRGMDEACVDTIITDPPYGLEFMGKDWDHGVPGAHFWDAALRVAKPGAFLLAFGGDRTHHRLMCAIEDAGWEIRTCIYWIFGSGFPKSLNVEKAIQKSWPAESLCVCDPHLTQTTQDFQADCLSLSRSCDEPPQSAIAGDPKSLPSQGGVLGHSHADLPHGDQVEGQANIFLDANIAHLSSVDCPCPVEHPSTECPGNGNTQSGMPLNTLPLSGSEIHRTACHISDKMNSVSGSVSSSSLPPGMRYSHTPHCTTCGKVKADNWDGWGTALKPAAEIIIVAMKPIETTFAENALKWGVAGLNIDGSRIPIEGEIASPKIERGPKTNGILGKFVSKAGEQTWAPVPEGRWPANVILDEAAAAALDEQSGERKSGGFVRGTEPSRTGQNGIYGVWERVANNPHCDTGGASRFFYCAKASRSERDAGLEGIPLKERGQHYGLDAGGSLSKQTPHNHDPQRNIHPTVKPLALMRYLCTLTMTPTGGVVLDPFMGSGSTGIAAKQTGRNFIGIEIDPGYYEIARRRIERAKVETQLRLEGV